MSIQFLKRFAAVRMAGPFWNGSLLWYSWDFDGSWCEPAAKQFGIFSHWWEGSHWKMGNDLTAEITVVSSTYFRSPRYAKSVMGIKSPLTEKENTHLSEAGKKQYEFIGSATHCLDIFWSHVVAYEKATKPKFFSIKLLVSFGQ